MDILIVIIFYKGLFQYYWVQITVIWLILSIYGYTTCEFLFMRKESQWNPLSTCLLQTCLLLASSTP